MTPVQKNQFTCSIVIPTYNRKDVVTRAIDSCLNQTLPAQAVIVVDDGSTDGSYEFLTEKYKSSETIRILRQENQGAGKARNLGVRESQTEWILFLDSDDEFHPRRIERTALALEEHPEIDVLGVGMGFNGYQNTIPETSPIIKPIDKRQFLLRHGTSVCLAFRREAFLEASGFARPKGDNEDHDLVLRMIDQGHRFAVLQEELGLIHTQDSRHSSGMFELSDWYRKVFCFWKEKYKEHNLSFLDRRVGLASLYFDSHLSAWEKGAKRLALSFLCKSFISMPLPAYLQRYGRWARYKRAMILLFPWN